MAWMLDTYSAEFGFAQTGVVGKPVEIGGSAGRDAATGLVWFMLWIRPYEQRKEKITETTVAIQGFGKVGMHAAIEAHALGAKVIAVSDVSGGIHNGDGLDIPSLVEYVGENPLLKDSRWRRYR